MAFTVPTIEPERLAAGETASWTRAFSDFQAGDGWSLSYALMPEAGEGQVITFNASASGNVHLVNVAAADTASWVAGIYNGQAFVTKGTEKYRVWEGVIEILPNFATAGSIDTRTPAKRILDFIDRSFERVAQKQVVEATIEGVQLRFRTLKELQDARNYWAIIAAKEQAARTGKTGRGIFARFRQPG